MITKIELVETLEAKGVATEEDLFRWCDNLRGVLLNQYPGTDIAVKALADSTPSELNVEVDDETSATSAKDTVQGIINHCRDLWRAVATRKGGTAPDDL